MGHLSVMVLMLTFKPLQFMGVIFMYLRLEQLHNMPVGSSLGKTHTQPSISVFLGNVYVSSRFFVLLCVLPAPTHSKHGDYVICQVI